MSSNFERLQKIINEAYAESFSFLIHVKPRNLPRSPYLWPRWSGPFEWFWCPINLQLSQTTTTDYVELVKELIVNSGSAIVFFISWVVWVPHNDINLFLSQTITDYGLLSVSFNPYFCLLVFGILVTFSCVISFCFFLFCPSWLSKCKQRVRNIFVFS